MAPDVDFPHLATTRLPPGVLSLTYVQQWNVVIVGTCHQAEGVAESVGALLRNLAPHDVAVELCDDRHRRLFPGKTLSTLLRWRLQAEMQVNRRPNSVNGGFLGGRPDGRFSDVGPAGESASETAAKLVPFECGPLAEGASSSAAVPCARPSDPAEAAFRAFLWGRVRQELAQSRDQAAAVFYARYADDSIAGEDLGLVHGLSARGRLEIASGAWRAQPQHSGPGNSRSSTGAGSGAVRVVCLDQQLDVTFGRLLSRISDDVLYAEWARPWLWPVTVFKLYWHFHARAALGLGPRSWTGEDTGTVRDVASRNSPEWRSVVARGVPRVWREQLLAVAPAPRNWPEVVRRVLLRHEASTEVGTDESSVGSEVEPTEAWYDAHPEIERAVQDVVIRERDDLMTDRLLAVLRRNAGEQANNAEGVATPRASRLCVAILGEQHTPGLRKRLLEAPLHDSAAHAGAENAGVGAKRLPTAHLGRAGCQKDTSTPILQRIRHACVTRPLRTYLWGPSVLRKLKLVL